MTVLSVIHILCNFFDVYFLPQSCNQEYFRSPLVRVDPDRRCSVMLIYGTHLVVLPFRQEGVLDEHEQEGAFTGRYSVYCHFVPGF